jgi:hypothetical protein
LNILAPKNIFGIAKFVDRSNDRHDRNGHCLAAFRDLAHRRCYGHAFIGWSEGMRRAEIIGLAVMFAYLTMPGIAQAPAMPEDVERSSIAVRQILPRFCIRLGIIQEDASLVGGLTVEASP